MVVVEVKSTLKNQDVADFTAKLASFKLHFPEYANNIIYGCVAYLHADGASNTQAEKAGLFVIRATGSSASIVNRSDFQPKEF